MISFIALSGPISAQGPAPETVTIRKDALTAEQLQLVEQQKLDQRIAIYGKWVGLGKEVGEAVNSSLTALTGQADNFAKTGVGKFTMFMVAWKVLGGDLMDILISVPLMILITCIFIWSYRKNCVVRSVLSEVKSDKTKVYKLVNDGVSKDDLGTYQLVHVIIYLICMAVLLGIAL